MIKEIKWILIFVIIIAIIFNVFKIINFKKEKKLNLIINEKELLIKNKDSLRIVNLYIDSLNKKTELQINKINYELKKNDSVINNSNLFQLKMLLEKHI